jgi:hypothetical protein
MFASPSSRMKNQTVRDTQDKPAVRRRFKPLALVVGVAVWLGITAHSQTISEQRFAPTAFEKDMEVRLLRDEPLYFKSQVHRSAKQGETFTVLAHQPGSGKVFIAADRKEGRIALSVAEGALERVVPGPETVIKEIAEAYERGEIAKAADLAMRAAQMDPQRKTYANLAEHLRALGSGTAEIAKTKAAATESLQKAAQLRRNAAVIDRPNRLVPSDNSGPTRAAAMRSQAEALEETAKKQVADLEMRTTTARTEIRQLLSGGQDGGRSWKSATDLREWSTLMKDESDRERQERLKAQQEQMESDRKAMEFARTSQSAREKREREAATETPFAKLLEKYGATDTDAVSEPQLQKGKYYFIGGGAGQVFYVAQVTDTFILAADVRKEPWAVLTFEDPKALETIQIPKKSLAAAVGRFDGFRTIEMVSGAAQRFPVFVCTGLNITGNGFVNTEKKE